MDDKTKFEKVKKLEDYMVQEVLKIDERIIFFDTEKVFNFLGVSMRLITKIVEKEGQDDIYKIEFKFIKTFKGENELEDKLSRQMATLNCRSEEEAKKMFKEIILTKINKEKVKILLGLKEFDYKKMYIRKIFDGNLNIVFDYFSEEEEFKKYCLEKINENELMNLKKAEEIIEKEKIKKYAEENMKGYEKRNKKMVKMFENMEVRINKFRLLYDEKYMYVKYKNRMYVIKKKI